MLCHDVNEAKTQTTETKWRRFGCELNFKTKIKKSIFKYIYISKRKG